MKTFIRIILIILLLSSSFDKKCFSKEYLYILNDRCINELAAGAEYFFRNTPIYVIRDSRGIILRFELKYPQKEYNNISFYTYQKIMYIEQFLAKIKNPVIIEVHTEKYSAPDDIKNWELSTVIANKIEDVMLNEDKNSFRDRVRSIGYGEFLPSKNTSNNGGNYLNRVDIIILCNVSGE